MTNPAPLPQPSRSYLATGAFWGGAAERCVKTVAQTLLALLTVDAATSVFSLNWPQVAGIALTAGAVSLLTSVVSAPIGPPGSPSMVNDRPAPVTDVAV